MSTQREDDAARAFTTYLTTVLTLAPSSTGEKVVIPHQASRMRVLDIRCALLDPGSMIRSGGDIGIRERLSAPLRFALWLQRVPSEFVPRDLASRAARYRFLLWSFFARLDTDVETSARPSNITWSDGVEEADKFKLSADWVRAEARSAREEWLGFVCAMENDPWLASLAAEASNRTDEDMRWLKLRWPPGSSEPLNLATSGTSDVAAHADQRRVAAEVAETHSLPAGRVGEAIRGLVSRPWLGWVIAATLPVLGALDLGVMLVSGAGPARVLAPVFLAMVIVTAPMLPLRLDSLALLRIPAAIAAGEVVLASLTSRWWLSPQGWEIGAGLFIASWWYLILEARLHGADRPSAFLRGSIIAVAGLLTSFLLSVSSLGFLVPAMGEHGECLSGWWAGAVADSRPLSRACAATVSASAAPSAMGVLALMSGFCLAVGLAAQILWDDRPVTSPLGRIRRVRGGQS